MFLTFLFYPYGLFAQQYSKQDIEDLVNHFKQYDEEMKDNFAMHTDKLKGLVTEIYEDLQNYDTKESLKNYINNLFDKYIAIGMDLKECLGNFRTQDGHYKPSQVPAKCHQLNLNATYLELKMRLLGYIYQDVYKEPYLNE